MGKIYYEDPSLAYKVLDPKRWIKRQHEGANGSSHARFMMSACHDFQEAFADKKSRSLLFNSTCCYKNIFANLYHRKCRRKGGQTRISLC